MNYSERQNWALPEAGPRVSSAFNRVFFLAIHGRLQIPFQVRKCEMEHKTAQEDKQDLIDELGAEFRGDLNDLQNSYLNILIGWRFYRSLFGTNQERIDLLNEASGDFSGFVEDALLEQTILGLCRLTDPIKSGKGTGEKKNLTFKMLKDYLNVADVREEYTKRLEKTDKLVKFARDWRNRRIAHNDYSVAKGDAKLDDASRDDVQKLLDAVGALLIYIHGEVLNTDLVLEHSFLGDDEMWVLEHLYDAKMEYERTGKNNFAREYPVWLKERGS